MKYLTSVGPPEEIPELNNSSCHMDEVRGGWDLMFTREVQKTQIDKILDRPSRAVQKIFNGLV